MSGFGFPYRIGRDGMTAGADEEAHVREMIEQVLFTSPGERVNRPTFGSGLMQLVFAPNSDELATAMQFLVQGALQQWLGDLILVESITADNQDSTLQVTVQYVVRRNMERRITQFNRTL